MEPNLNNINFFSEDYVEETINICNIYSCWRCQGKDPPNKETRNKIKEINKSKKPKKYNPNDPAKVCLDINCK